jgi:nucleolin
MSTTIDFDTIMNAITSIEERMKKQHKQVGVVLKALEQKIEGMEVSGGGSSEKVAKKDKPKREQSEGQKAWTEFVKEVWADMKEENPKATYKDAMTEASKRKDEDDPEGAKKRADAREKRAEAKERKSAGSSKSASKDASDSESEEEKPKKKAKKVVKEETDASESDAPAPKKSSKK